MLRGADAVEEPELCGGPPRLPRLRNFAFSLLPILVVGLLNYSISSLATEVRIIKVKGNRIIGEVQDQSELEPNQMYHLVESTFDTEFGQREWVAGLSGEVSSLFTKSSGNVNTYTVSPKYGWNRGWYEFGLQGTVSSIDRAGTTTDTFILGLFYDFDFLENKPTRPLIPGLGFKVQPGEKTVSNGSTSTTLTLVLEAGPKLESFLGRSSTAVRLDLVYHFETDAIISSSGWDQTGGLRLLAGIESYF